LLLTAWPVGGWPLLDGTIAVCLAGRIVAACWVVRKLRSERLMTARGMSIAIVLWSLFALLVSWLCLDIFFSLAPVVAIGSDLGHGVDHEAFWFHLYARVAGITVLMLPLARPLAAPLALARNRTR
jgi:hypothetical protein